MHPNDYIVLVSKILYLNEEKKNIDRKVKILQISPFYPPSVGGISNLVFNLCEKLSENKINIRIITSRGIIRKDIPLERDQPNIVECKSFYLPGWPYSTLKNFSFPIDCGLKINSIIKNGKFDIVHVHGHHYPISWIALHSAHKQKIPTVLSLHGTYALNPKVLGGKSFIEDLFNKFIFAKVLKKCDAIVGGTTEIIEYASKYSSSSSKFRLIPNGVLTNNYLSNLIKKADFREKFYLDKHKLVVLYVGRFDESKGALEFARAAKMLLNAMPNVFQVLMVGEGHLETEIRKITQGLDGMQIKEWQPATTIHEFYIASDFYVLSSKFEGLPLSIIEAMNANLHIVYSDVGGVNDILKGYKKKSILKNSTPEEIFEVLSEKSNDKSLTDIHQPSMVYAQSFDWANIAAEMELLYKELIFFR